MKTTILMAGILIAGMVQAGSRSGFTNYDKTSPIITRAGGVTFLVTETHFRKCLPSGLEAADCRRYLVIGLSIKNIDTTKFHANPTCFSLIVDGRETIDGRSYYYENRDLFDLVNLCPGTSMNGFIQFEVPYKATRFQLFYDPIKGDVLGINLPIIKVP